MGSIELKELLDRLEPGIPPSQRYNRLVRIDMVEVLEMRDPNDGQNPGPEYKTRHQYLMAGGKLWVRHLPPETVGDRWPFDPEGGRWEVRVNTPLVLRGFENSIPRARVAVLHREAVFCPERRFQIVGELVPATDDEDVSILCGPITESWWCTPLPTCPDCGGHIVWWEAGYVPGTRKCVGRPVERHENGKFLYLENGGCGSLFRIDTEG